MAYISVDVELDEFDTDELVSEFCRRIKRNGSRKSLSDEEKKMLKESCLELLESLSVIPTKTIAVRTLEDEMKMEHLMKVFNKYTSFDMEKLLPE